MPDQFTKPTATLLALTYHDSLTPEQRNTHEGKPRVVINSVQVCVCAECFNGMCALAEQWDRDFDSMIEDMRRSSRAFLGFDVWEEWYRKSS